MEKDNVWYLKQSAALEAEIIKHFTANGRWGKVIWNNNEYLDATTPANIRAVYDMHRFIEVPEAIYNQIYPHFFLLVDMQVRRSPWSSLIYDQKNVHDYLNIFNKLLNITYKTLIENDISLVIMNRSPHFAGDMMLYLVAKALNIRTLLFEQSILPNRYFYYWDHYDYGTFATATPVNDIKPESIPNSFEKDLFYMRRVTAKPNLKERFRKFFGKEIRFVKETVTHSGWEQSLQRYALRSRYDKNSRAFLSTQIDLGTPFVYFALHLQPEKTTSTWGGMYSDQLLAIERLSGKLPEGWQIYVKDNPKQSFTMRGEWFYDRLMSIPNVQLVEENTYTLLKHCRFAATITGTVGWEAITGGKNVLVFGWGTWYKTLPGVFQYDENFTVDQILKYKIDHKELEEAVAILKSKMLSGIIYTAYSKAVPDFNEKKNLEMVIQNFNRILYTEPDQNKIQ